MSCLPTRIVQLATSPLLVSCVIGGLSIWFQLDEFIIMVSAHESNSHFVASSTIFLIYPRLSEEKSLTQPPLNKSFDKLQVWGCTQAEMDDQQPTFHFLNFATHALTNEWSQFDEQRLRGGGSRMCKAPNTGFVKIKPFLTNIKESVIRSISCYVN